MKNILFFSMLSFFSTAFLSCTKNRDIAATVVEKSNTNADAITANKTTGTVYISGYGGVLYALDALSGRVKWRIKKKAFYYVGTPCLKDSILYVKTSPDLYGVYISAINAFTGEELWDKKVSNKYPSDNSQPYISEDGMLYVGVSYELIAFDVNTKTVKWKVTGAASFSSPTVVNNSVYAIDRYNIYSFDAVSGAVKWKVELPGNGSSPTVLKNHVIYTTYNSIVSLDTNGKQQWFLNTRYFMVQNLLLMIMVLFTAQILIMFMH